MLKAYAIGFLAAVLAVALAAGIWLALRPAEEPGLLWGGTVYTSKQEFNRYLKSRGLSYKVWLARNPGAAPWEPAREGAAVTKPTPRAARPGAGAAREGWVDRLPVAAIGAALGILCLLILLTRALLPALARMQTARAASAGGSARVDAPPSGERARFSAIRRFEAALPHYAQRLAGAGRGHGRLLPERLRPGKLRLADLAFGLLALATGGMFLLFVALLLSA